LPRSLGPLLLRAWPFSCLNLTRHGIGWPPSWSRQLPFQLPSRSPSISIPVLVLCRAMCAVTPNLAVNAEAPGTCIIPGSHGPTCRLADVVRRQQRSRKPSNQLGTAMKFPTGSSLLLASCLSVCSVASADQATRVEQDGDIAGKGNGHRSYIVGR
jgi:hypothetical protein